MSFIADNCFFQLCVALKKLIKGDGVDIQSYLHITEITNHQK